MGHVHVIRGDLTKIDCDAWLLPTDGELVVEQSWFGQLQPEMQGEFEADRVGMRQVWRLAGGPPAGWSDEKERATAVPGWTDGSRPWLVNVGGDADTPIEWYIDGVEKFLDVALPHARRPGGRRLVALPTVGTARGGADQRKAELIRELLEALSRAAHRGDVDIALVTRTEADFAAVQHARRELGDKAWPRDDASARLFEDARRVAGHARAGKLAVLMGAGVSVATGVPSWNALLAELARAASLDEPTLATLASLDERDRGQYLQNRLGASELRRRVAALVGKATHHSLIHSLLAALPVEAFITTNYDGLFEVAVAGMEGPPLSVIPYAPRPESDRWLLKLHGCTTREDDIVLARSDYARYGERRGALLGIVQSVLLTRHLLFVGFSLIDENFHDVADVVRRALPPGAPRKFGTAVMYDDPKARGDLWKDEIDLVVTKQVTLFLDRLLFEATTGTSHFMDPAFDALFNDKERALRRELERVRDEFRPRLGNSAVWKEVEGLLVALGDKGGSQVPMASRNEEDADGD